MPIISRKTQKIFAQNATNNGQFGSAQLGTKVLSSDLATLQALPAFSNGWNSATMSAKKLPTLEEFQALHYITTSQIAYLFQEGIAEYDSGTEYRINSLVKKSGTAQIYKSLTDANIGNALTDNTKWALTLDNATTSTKGVSLLPQQITIANNSTDTEHDIDFSVGNAQADDGSLVWPATAMTKRIDATWVAGNNQGGLDTGTVANNTPYYCFAIYNPTTLASDFLFSASKSSPTLPSGYTKKYYLGGLRTDGSANIRPGNYKYGRNCYEFLYKDGILDVSTATIPTTRTVLTTTVLPLSKVNFIATYVDDDVSDNSIVFTEEGQSDEVPGDDDDLFSDQNYASKTNRSMWTNSSSQIYWRGGDAAAVLFRFKTLGWFEYL